MIINITTIANIIMNINNLERKTVLLLATGSSSFAAELGRGINARRGNENTKSNQFMADPFKARCRIITKAFVQAGHIHWPSKASLALT